MPKSYLLIESTEEEGKYLKEDDEKLYSYGKNGTRFNLSNMPMVNKLAEQYNGKVILIEPDWAYE
jgi:hypothetical protein